MKAVAYKILFIVENCDVYKIFVTSVPLFSVYSLKH
jgi:hypothetical protein